MNNINARIEWNWNWAALGVALLGILAVVLAAPFGYEAAINRFLVAHGFSSTHIDQLQFAHVVIAAPFALIGLVCFVVGLRAEGRTRKAPIQKCVDPEGEAKAKAYLDSERVRIGLEPRSKH